MATAAILGASGYSGQETLDRVLRHPELEVVALGSDSLAGEPAAALDYRLNGSLPRFVPNDEALAAGADVVFACLSHDRAARLDPPAAAVVVDLSGAHQHAPEIAQALGFPVCFVPHLLPVRRGLLATCYVQPDGDLRSLLEDAYADSDVVRVLPEGVVPELARVQHTDGAEIAVFEDRATSHAVVICALDNLGKGAAGQALQNANLALGFEQTLGLRLAGVLV